MVRLRRELVLCTDTDKDQKEKATLHPVRKEIKGSHFSFSVLQNWNNQDIKRGSLNWYSNVSLIQSSFWCTMSLKFKMPNQTYY